MQNVVDGRVIGVLGIVAIVAVAVFKVKYVVKYSEDGNVKKRVFKLKTRELNPDMVAKVAEMLGTIAVNDIISITPAGRFDRWACDRPYPSDAMP